MMYRVFLFLIVLTYCSSFPLTVSNLPKFVNTLARDDSDLVDNAGAGYSYFGKQDIDVRASPQRSSIPFSNPDISEYMYSSALQPQQQPIQTQMFMPSNNQLLNRPFGQQQQLLSRPNLPLQPLLPRNIQTQPSVLFQNDLGSIATGYNGQQSNLLSQNLFRNQPQDLNTISSQQVLLPRTNLNFQDQRFTDHSNQQQLLSIPQQSQPTWSTQQQSTGFSSSFDSQNQRPVSFGFVSQSNQQNEMKPITNTLFMSSQLPPRRMLAQSQPSQQVFNGGW